MSIITWLYICTFIGVALSDEIHQVIVKLLHEKFDLYLFHCIDPEDKSWS